MRGSLPAHVSVMLVLLGWSVVAAVRERLGLDAHGIETRPAPRPVILAQTAPRRDPEWMRIN
jgi:hypothetical protein